AMPRESCRISHELDTCFRISSDTRITLVRFCKHPTRTGCGVIHRRDIHFAMMQGHWGKHTSTYARIPGIVDKFETKHSMAVGFIAQLREQCHHIHSHLPRIRHGYTHAYAALSGRTTCARRFLPRRAEGRCAGRARPRPAQEP